MDIEGLLAIGINPFDRSPPAPPTDADIVEAATKALENSLNYRVWGSALGKCEQWDPYYTKILAASVISAVLPHIEQAATERERERCARIAEDYRSDGNPFPTIYAAIAAAIRTAPKGSEGK